MKKYLDKNKCIEFLLSLNLYEGKTDKDTLKTIYAISNNVENNYQVFKIKKRNGKLRTIYAPTYNLKKIQKKILKNILEKIPVSKYAKAYTPGISLKENSLMHVDKKIVLKLDIKDFFPSITFTEVLNCCFSPKYYPDSIAVLLSNLCTYYDYLPQGAPTSSYISNVVMREFDEIVGNFCEERNISYSRYSDDLTFSGDFDYKEMIKFIDKELQKRGFLLNKKKTVIVSQKTRQVVTGIVVNKKAQIEKNYRRKIRQELYYIKKYGIDEHIIKTKVEDKDKYLASFKGRINYCLQVNPQDKNMQSMKKEMDNCL